VRGSIRAFRAWLLGETWALPVDLFRVLVGLLASAYFLRLITETPDFSSPDGLLDHAWLAQVLWFTRWSLFQPGLPAWIFYLAYGLGVGGGLAIAAGIRTRSWGLLLFLIAASQSRWNFVVFSIDDGVMQLVLFWLVLLPAGRTLTLRDWWRDPGGALDRWRGVTVPGAAVRCLMGNLLLIYLTAGLCKLGSHYWRTGFALYAILRQPIAWAPDWWSPAMLPGLTLATWAALLTELSLPILLARRAATPLKWLALPLAVGFHLGIVATLRVPFANLAMLAGLPLFFGRELMRRLGGPPLDGSPPAVTAWRAGDRIAVGVLVTLVLAMLRGVPLVGPVHRPAFALLWAVGLAQDYHLFGWIDGINYHASSQARLRAPGRPDRWIPPERVLPPAMRYTLLQAYLHRVPWMLFPRAQRGDFAARVVTRLERRRCAREPWNGTIELTTAMTRITPEDPALRDRRVDPPIRLHCGVVVLLGGGLGAAGAEGGTQQGELRLAEGAGHDVIEQAQPFLLAPLAEQQPHQGVHVGTGLPVGGGFRPESEQPVVALAQPFVAHPRASGPMPIAVSRSRRSERPRYSRLRVLGSVQPSRSAISSRW